LFTLPSATVHGSTIGYSKNIHDRILAPRVGNVVTSKEQMEVLRGSDDDTPLRQSNTNFWGRGSSSESGLARAIEEFNEAFEYEMKMMDHHTEIPASEYAYGCSTLTFKDLCFTAMQDDGTEKEILRKCSGHFEAGDMVAIMGPSGCGKSTLLDMLAQKKPRHLYKGQVALNGAPPDHLYSRLTTYVPQEDVMPGVWTVQEAILFNYKLKHEIPSNLNNPEMRHKVLEPLLKQMGLWHVKNTFIGDDKVRGISGGQRRRVTLLRGMVSGAQVMFCDEPTSGLSATDAESCVKALRIIAKSNKVIVVVVIHQPRIEVSQLFDKLVLLTSQPGRMCYNGLMSELGKGESEGALRYFNRLAEQSGNETLRCPPRANPTDFFLDMVTPGAEIKVFMKGGDPVFMRREDFYASQWQESQEKLELNKLVEKQIDLGEDAMTAFRVLEKVCAVNNRMQSDGGMPALPPPKDNPEGAPFKRQVRAVLIRKLHLARRDSNVIAQIVVAVFQAIVIGLAFQGIGEESPSQQYTFLSMLLMLVSFGGNLVVPALIQESAVMARETNDKLYSAWAYVMSSWIVNTLLGVFSNFLLFVIMFALSSTSFSVFGDFYKWTLLLQLTMDSFWSAFASNSKKAQDAQQKAMPILFLWTFFNGMFVTKESCPVFMIWAIYTSPLFWIMEQISVDLFHGSPEGQAALNFVGFEDGHQWIAVGYCIGLITIMRCWQVYGLTYVQVVAK